MLLMLCNDDLISMFCDPIHSFVFSEGGMFKAHMLFPKEYPHRPPKMKFVSEMWHPNSKYLSLFLINDCCLNSCCVTLYYKLKLALK